MSLCRRCHCVGGVTVEGVTVEDVTAHVSLCMYVLVFVCVVHVCFNVKEYKTRFVVYKI